MAIIFKNRKIEVVDRSMVFILNNSKDIKKEKLASYCEYLLETGADFLEIEMSYINIMMNDYNSFPLILKINSLLDLKNIPDNIDRVVIKWKCFLFWATHFSSFHINRNFILEFDISEIEDFKKKWDLISEKNRRDIIKLRINNFDKVDFVKYKEDLIKIKEDLFRIGISFEVSPCNVNKTGTATVLDLVKFGVDSIVCSFAGAEPFFSDVSLEEVLVAHTILNTKTKNDERFFGLQNLKINYESLTQKKVFSQKPIIGKEIFYYESSIHADGIEKNPETYEPFDPKIVGQNRKMCLGKHSSINSIEKKLKERSFLATKECLLALKNRIKEQSIIKKAIIDDEYFFCLVKDYDINGTLERNLYEY